MLAAMSTQKLPLKWQCLQTWHQRQGYVNGEICHVLVGITWIMKPCGRAQGKGIFLLDKLSQVCPCHLLVFRLLSMG